MKKIFLFLVLFISVQAARAQFPITLTGYPLVTTGWTWGGAAGGTTPSVVDSTLRITTTGTNEANYLVYNTSITMANYCQWQADFDFQITSSSSGTADGMTFFFLSDPPTSGTTGGGLGLPTSPLGLMLIFDTYNNIGVSDVPIIQLLGFSGIAGETAYTEDGTIGQLCPFLTNQSFVTNGVWHHVTITYNMGNINVYFNYSATASQSGFFDLSGYTGKFGFTGSTGAVYSTQKVKNVNIVASQCLTPENNGPVCEGDTLKLYAIGDSTGATYAWTGPDGFTSTMQDPTIPYPTIADSGIYRVIRTNGGIDTGYTDVVIKRKPVVTAANNSPICSGSTLSLTASPDSTGETFSWTGPNTFTSVVENPTIAGATQVDTGIYTVIATWNGCLDTATTHVSITYLSVPVGSNTGPYCEGETVQLNATDSVLTGVTYSWSGPAGYTSALQNPTIPGSVAANSGIYTVTATLGLCSYSDTTLVTVNIVPKEPNDTPILPVCSGTTLHLYTSDSTAGVAYHWSGPNGFSSTMQNPSIPNAPTSATGTYSVYVTLANCTSLGYSRIITVDSTPEAPVAFSNSPICSDYGVVLLTSTDGTDGVTYSWAGPDAFVSHSQDTTIIDPQTYMSGNYTVTATLTHTAITCTSTNFTYVTINQTPNTPSTSNNGPVCSGGLLTLTAVSTPSTGTYYWSGPNSFTSTIELPQINNVTLAATGIYSVYETVNNCTSPTGYDTVTILPSPAVPVPSSNTPICNGDTLKLFATDDTVSVSYSWSGPSSFASIDQNPVIYNAGATAGGLYLVTATFGNCSESATTNVNITPIPDLTVSNNGPICAGDTLKLFANSTSTVTYSWTGPFGYGVISQTPTRFPTIPEDGGFYTVTATTIANANTATCSYTTLDTVVINAAPAPPWIVWPTYCVGYDAPPLQAVDATDVLWFPSAAPGGTGTTTAPTPSTAVPGVYYFYLNQTVNGCVSAIDSIEVTVRPRPEMALTPATAAICPHDSVTLTAIDPDPLDVFHWMPDVYLENDTLNPIVIARPITNTTYTLVVTNRFGCTDTAYSTITVYPAAVIYLGVADTVTLFPGDSYSITPTTNCNTFEWFPPEGLSSTTIADPIVTPVSNSMYTVIGVTDNGCSTTATIDFSLAVEPIFAAPNAFTPGNGVNNIFKLIRLGNGVLNYFRVYDRWGKQVFETNDADNGWDGTFNGTPQPFGVYVYEVQAVSSKTGKITNMSGNITLLR